MPFNYNGFHHVTIAVEQGSPRNNVDRLCKASVDAKMAREDVLSAPWHQIAPFEGDNLVPDPGKARHRNMC